MHSLGSVERDRAPKTRSSTPRLFREEPKRSMRPEVRRKVYLKRLFQRQRHSCQRDCSEEKLRRHCDQRVNSVSDTFHQDIANGEASGRQDDEGRSYHTIEALLDVELRQGNCDDPEEPDRQSNVLCGSQPFRKECKCQRGRDQGLTVCNDSREPWRNKFSSVEHPEVG